MAQKLHFFSQKLLLGFLPRVVSMPPVKSITASHINRLTSVTLWMNELWLR